MTHAPTPAIVLASSNADKLREFSAIFQGLQLSLIPQADFGITDVAETGLTFVENAILKARNACKHTGLPALADDSGIEVDILDGAPGVFSARYAGGGEQKAGSVANCQKLLNALIATSPEERGAHFQCVLVFMRHETDPSPLICQGSWQGKILTAPRGENGFGYDPIFYVPEYDCSAAELSLAIKNSISHRAQAVAQFIQQLPLKL